MRIPDNAKLAFHGKIFDVYQWEQEMFDGTHQTFEMLDRPDTNQIIAVQDGKILVTKESQPNKSEYYSLPGGRLELNEDPLEGAKRELREETGLEASDWDLFRMYEPLHKIDWKIYYYIARDCHKVAEPHLDAGERIETLLLTFDEFLDFLMTKYSGAEFVLDVLKMKTDGQALRDFRRRLLGDA